MSLSRGCVAIERQPGQWYCIVAHDEYDYDFNSYNIYGPCLTADAALEKMHRQEANPGSHDVVSHASLTDYYTKLVDDGLKLRAEIERDRREHERQMWRRPYY